MANCKFCHMGGLTWEQTLNKKWILLDNAGQKHCCVKPKLYKNSSNTNNNEKILYNDPKIDRALKEFKKSLDKNGKKDYYLR